MHKDAVQPATIASGLSTTSLTTNPTMAALVRKKTGNTIAALLDSVGKRTPGVPKHFSALSIAQELSTYRSLASKEYHDITENGSKNKEYDTMAFWRVHQHVPKYLSQLSRQFLCSPPTSVPSESALNTASFLGRKERARISPANLYFSMFLKDKVNDASD
jgi:hypothetical protein